MGKVTADRIQDVPIEFYGIAKRDPSKFARAYGCYALDSIHPFFANTDVIKKSINFNRESPFNGDSYSFHNNFICNDVFRRYIHIDLGWKRDRCGIAMCHVPKGVTISRQTGQNSSFVDRRPLPFLYYDFIGVINPERGVEIQFDFIIELIHILSSDLHFDLALVTYDGWQSVGSIQRLNREGFLSGNLSVDRTAKVLVIDRDTPNGIREKSTSGKYLTPWENYKDALIDERIEVPFYNPEIPNRLNQDITLYEEELLNLEEDGDKKKIDHPADGTKDLMDAIVGAGLEACVNEWGIEDYDTSKHKFYRDDENLPMEKPLSFIDKSIEDIYEDNDTIGF